MSRHVTLGLAVFCLAFLSIAYLTRDANAQSASDIAGVQAASKAFLRCCVSNTPLSNAKERYE